MTAATFMDMLDGSIVNVALPTLQADLGASYTQLQWVSAGYVLPFALLLITGGRLGDIYGRKRLFQIGVVAFTLCSLACGIATDPSVLVVTRVLQGAAAGIMVPQVLATIHVTFPAEEKATVYAIYGTVGGLAATVAPLIGALLVGLNLFGLDWRPIFLVNVPIGILGLILGHKYIPESKAHDHSRLDLVGVVLASGALLLLLVPLTLGREEGWPMWTYVAMAASAVVLVAFVAVERSKERRNESPLVPMSLFRARSLSASLAVALSCFTLTGMTMLAIYMYMQIGLGWTPIRSGVTMLAFATGAFVTASLSVMVLVPKFGRTVLQVGAVGVAAGLGLFLFSNGNPSGVTSWQLVPALFVMGLGFGAAATPTSMFGLNDVPFKDAGSASGLINTTFQLGFAFGIAATTLAFFAPLGGAAATVADDLAPDLSRELVSAGVPEAEIAGVQTSFEECVRLHYTGSSPQANPASCAPSGAVAGNDEAVQVLGEFTETARKEIYAVGMNDTVRTAGVLALIALICASFLPRRLRPEEAH